MANSILRASGIYAIRNTVNGKTYVGQSVDLPARKAEHFRMLRTDSHSCRHLQSAYAKHGVESFEFSVLEACGREELTAREQHWMDVLRPSGLYNTAPAAGSNAGFRHSPETRAAMSLARMGRKGPMGMLGKTHTPEAKAKVAAARLGKKLSDAAKAKISAVHAGRKLSTAHLAKMSVALRGMPKSDEWKRKMSATMTGKTPSPETVEKMRQAQLGKKQDPELVARRIAATWAARRANRERAEKT